MNLLQRIQYVLFGTLSPKEDTATLQDAKFRKLHDDYIRLRNAYQNITKEYMRHRMSAAETKNELMGYIEKLYTHDGTADEYKKIYDLLIKHKEAKSRRT